MLQNLEWVAGYNVLRAPRPAPLRCRKAHLGGLQERTSPGGDTADMPVEALPRMASTWGRRFPGESVFLAGSAYCRFEGVFNGYGVDEVGVIMRYPHRRIPDDGRTGADCQIRLQGGS